MYILSYYIRYYVIFVTVTQEDFVFLGFARISVICKRGLKYNLETIIVFFDHKLVSFLNELIDFVQSVKEVTNT